MRAAPFEEIEDGSVTSARGFLAGAAACGLKPAGALDVALVASEGDCAGAGLFTRNRVVAAPVTVCRETLAGGRSRLRAVVANAGNANAFTGPKGLEAAHRMQASAARALGIEPGQVLVLSTGVIGVPLDNDRVQTGILAAAAALSADGDPAAQAILTTDTVAKQAAVRLNLAGGKVTIGGMAKGAGMIHPDMATMLAVLTTDALVEPDQLQESLARAVEASFNRISVDGDTSTNDSVLLLANGASGVAIKGESALAAFDAGLEAVCRALALEIVRDGEGASRVVEVVVQGAGKESEALQVARTIATSPLVKTAIAGGDPNWGRVLAAAGRAGVPMDPDRLTLTAAAGGIELILAESGAAAAYNEAEAAAIFAAPAFRLELDLGRGTESAAVWTCDLSEAYVRINASYRS